MDLLSLGGLFSISEHAISDTRPVSGVSFNFPLEEKAFFTIETHSARRAMIRETAFTRKHSKRFQGFLASRSNVCFAKTDLKSNDVGVPRILLLKEPYHISMDYISIVEIDVMPLGKSF